MSSTERINRTFAKLVLTAVVLFLLIIAAEHGTMTVLADAPAVCTETRTEIQAGVRTEIQKEFQKESRNADRKAVYESVKVGEGETLETIADRYDHGDLSRDEYIETLQSINGIHGTRVHRGCWIAVLSYR